MNLQDYIEKLDNGTDEEYKRKFTFIKEKIEPVVGFILTNIQTSQLLMFYDLIIEKNKVMNLTAITDFEEFVVKHYVDSLEIKRAIDLQSKEYEMIDIGTGAGFPGIPLKIVYPYLKISLFDSLLKRLNFLDDVIYKLEIKNIKTIHGRAEEFGRKLEYREKYDIVVSRAVAGLNTLCELTIPFCKKGGVFIAYKGGKGNDELTLAKKCISELGGNVDKVINYELSLSDINNERTLIKIEKIKNTIPKYPRGGGKPFKEPLYIDSKE